MCLTLTIALSLYTLLRYATRVYMRFRLPPQARHTLLSAWPARRKYVGSGCPHECFRLPSEAVGNFTHLPSQEVITGRFNASEVTPGACTSSLVNQNQHGAPPPVDRGAPSGSGSSAAPACGR